MSDVDVVDEVSADDVREVQALIDAAAREDGQPAVSEQGRLQLRGGSRPGVRHLLLRAGDGALSGYAQLEDTDPVEAPAGELVVAPTRRGNGHGRRLGQALLDQSGRRLRVWAHGGHPAARHLAQSLGMTLFRELRQLRRSLAGLELPDPVLPDGVTVRAFRPGEDDAAWAGAERRRLRAPSRAGHPHPARSRRPEGRALVRPGRLLPRRAGREAGRLPLDEGALGGGTGRGLRPRGRPR